MSTRLDEADDMEVAHINDLAGADEWFDALWVIVHRFPDLAGFEPATVAMCAVPLVLAHAAAERKSRARCDSGHVESRSSGGPGR